MAEVGYAANRRLLDAECISHHPADGAAALEAITSPVISTTCTRIPGMRFPDPASRPSWAAAAPSLLIPGLAQLTSPGPPGRSPLRQADRAYRDALTDLARQASLAALPHLQLSPAVITSQHPPVISRHTRRNLTRNSKSLRGKITYGTSPPKQRPLHFPAFLIGQLLQ